MTRVAGAVLACWSNLAGRGNRLAELDWGSQDFVVVGFDFGGASLIDGSMLVERFEDMGKDELVD